MYVCAFLETWEKLLFIDLLICFISWQISTLLLKRLLASVVNSAYWRDYLFGYLPKITKYVPQTHGLAHFPLQLLWPISFADDQVLIFSQWTKLLDIMDYYFSEKGFEVCRIDGSVKLDERRRQVFSYAYSAFSLLLSNILTIYYKYKVSLSSLPWNRSKTSVMRRAAVEYFSSVPELGDSESILLLLIHASSMTVTG